MNKLNELKYAILRRAICGRTKPTEKVYALVALRVLCSELEGKTLEELKKVHKKWIGY